VLLGLEFSDLEIMQLFVEFSKTYDENLDFQFDIKEFINLIEVFANPDLLGPKKWETIINLSGVECKWGKYEYIFGNTDPLNFNKLSYKKLYDILCDVK